MKDEYNTIQDACIVTDVFVAVLLKVGLNITLYPQESGFDSLFSVHTLP